MKDMGVLVGKGGLYGTVSETLKIAISLDIYTYIPLTDNMLLYYEVEYLWPNII